MDDREKKLFARLDDDAPGVRAKALDALRDQLKKAGRTLQDLIHEFENSVPAQQYELLEANYARALQDNEQWVQHNQKQERTIAALARELAGYRAIIWARFNWPFLLKSTALCLLSIAGFAYVTNWWLSLPSDIESGLRGIARNATWGQWFDRPFISFIDGTPYWVLLQGEVDSDFFADKFGHPIIMRCLHVHAVRAVADGNEFRKPEPYGLFGRMKWPERVVECTPAPDSNPQAGRRR